MTRPISRSVVVSVFAALVTGLFVTSCGNAAADREGPSPGPSTPTISQQATASVSRPGNFETPSPESDLSIDEIHRFAGDPGLQLEYKESTVLMNSPDADVLVDVYQDGWGASYYVDHERHQVVQFNIGYLLPPVGETMPLEELRVRAEELFGQKLSSDSGAVDELSYEEGSKDPGNYFFRWQSSNGGWLYNPPIFQVGLRADGMLLTYINTLGYR